VEFASLQIFSLPLKIYWGLFYSMNCRRLQATIWKTTPINCPQVLIKYSYICSYPPYLQAISACKVRVDHAVATGDEFLTMFFYETYLELPIFCTDQRITVRYRNCHIFTYMYDNPQIKKGGLNIEIKL
jgi:hypothetical protein